MNLNATKRSYHPFVFLAWYLNFLPQEITQQIPRSTLSDWKQKDKDLLFGNDYFARNRALFETLEAVAHQRQLQKAVRVLLSLPSNDLLPNTDKHYKIKVAALFR